MYIMRKLIKLIYYTYENWIRADADDGLLCGVLLMPMVGCAQLINTITKYNKDPLQIGNN